MNNFNEFINILRVLSAYTGRHILFCTENPQYNTVDGRSLDGQIVKCSLTLRSGARFKSGTFRLNVAEHYPKIKEAGGYVFEGY